MNQKKLIIKENMDSNPELKKGRQLIVSLLSMAAGFRVVSIFVSVAYFLVRANSFGIRSFVNITVLLLSIVLYLGISQGNTISIYIGLLLEIPLFCYYTAFVFRILVFTLYPFSILRIGLLLISGAVQIVVMLFILFDQSCKTYRKTLKQMKKTLRHG